VSKLVVEKANIVIKNQIKNSKSVSSFKTFVLILFHFQRENSDFYLVFFIVFPEQCSLIYKLLLESFHHVYRKKEFFFIFFLGASLGAP